MHNTQLLTNGVEDPETLAFWRDLQRVMDQVHQGMAIVGPWMEARIKEMTSTWLPPGWMTSGPSQIFKPARDGFRSRSWDLVIHRVPEDPADLPPPATNESGYPLLRECDVVAVIDTKTNFSDPASYARLSIFNLMNDATETQLSFLDQDIARIILAASSYRSPDSLFAAGEPFGLNAFSLARYFASPVSDGLKRKSGWRLERFSNGSYPLQRYKHAVIDAIDRYARRQVSADSA